MVELFSSHYIVKMYARWSLDWVWGLLSAHEMWQALKEKYGGLLVTKLRELVLKFENYKIRPNHTMKQHLRKMKRMIRGGYQIFTKELWTYGGEYDTW